MIKFLSRLLARRVETKTRESELAKHQVPPGRLPESARPAHRPLNTKEAKDALLKAEADLAEARLRQAYGYDGY